MPLVSRSQARWAFANQNAGGSEGAAARDFIAATPKGGIKKLPEHVKKKKPKRPAIFGSLVPHQANHYEAGVNPDGGTEG